MNIELINYLYVPPYSQVTEWWGAPTMEEPVVKKPVFSVRKSVTDGVFFCRSRKTTIHAVFPPQRDSASVALDFRARLLVMLVNKISKSPNPLIHNIWCYFWLGGSCGLRGDVVRAHAHNVSVLDGVCLAWCGNECEALVVIMCWYVLEYKAVWYVNGRANVPICRQICMKFDCAILYS